MPAVIAGQGFEAGIVSGDEQRLLAFYRDILGFEELSPIPIPGHCLIHRLRCGASTLRIVVPEKPPIDGHVGDEFMSATGLRYLLIELANVRETIEEVRAAGCEIAVEPWEIRPGRIVSQVRDPEGNYVELVQGG